MDFEDIEFRLQYLISQNKENVTGVQLGVGHGLEPLRLLTACPNLILNCVDPWDQRYRRRYEAPEWYDVSSPRHSDAYNDVVRALKPFVGRVKIVKGFFDEVSYSFKDGSLDFVFINNNTVLEEEAQFTQNVMLWIPKINDGGMICGRRWVEQAEGKMLFSTQMEYCQFADGSWILSPVNEDVRLWAIKTSNREGDWNEHGYFETTNPSFRPFQ